MQMATNTNMLAFGGLFDEVPSANGAEILAAAFMGPRIEVVPACKLKAPFAGTPAVNIVVIGPSDLSAPVSIRC